MTDEIAVARKRIQGPDGRPIGGSMPDAAQRQAARLQFELALGRRAIQIVAALLYERREKKLTVRGSTVARLQEDGYNISIRTIGGKLRAQLLAPGEQPDPVPDEEAVDNAVETVDEEAEDGGPDVPGAGD